jgi:hypothetical protein
MVERIKKSIRIPMLRFELFLMEQVATMLTTVSWNVNTGFYS